MSVNTRIKLFKIYLKPLLYYGINALELNEKELYKLKVIEGNLVKQVLGISKHCQTTLLYSALRIELTADTYHKMQYEFVMRLQENQFVVNFLKAMIKKNIGVLHSIKERLKINESETSLETLNSYMRNEIVNIEQRTRDSCFNDEVREIEVLLNIANTRYRSYKLNKRLSVAFRKSNQFGKGKATINLRRYLPYSKTSNRASVNAG